MQPPFTKRREVSERDNRSSICFSWLSTSQWIWNYCIPIFSKKLQLNIYVLLSNFMLVALFYITPAWPFALRVHFIQLFHSHSINIAPFFLFLHTSLSLSVSPSPCALSSIRINITPSIFHPFFVLSNVALVLFSLRFI